jgi:predicted 3-demethylubiquinone-9 3-methyltransferase (glyoxalase superfamily)
MTNFPMLKTFIWYPKGLGEALDFYQDIFKENMTIHSKSHLDENEIFTADFEIFGQEMIGMGVEGGPGFSEAISLHVICDGQEQVDYYWEALSADGGEKGQCGWLKDKFGVSWQVTPIQMRQFLGHLNPETAQKNMAALRSMRKIVLAEFSN